MKKGHCCPNKTKQIPYCKALAKNQDEWDKDNHRLEEMARQEEGHQSLWKKSHNIFINRIGGNYLEYSRYMEEIRKAKIDKANDKKYQGRIVKKMEWKQDSHRTCEFWAEENAQKQSHNKLLAMIERMNQDECSLESNNLKKWKTNYMQNFEQKMIAQ